MKTEKFIELSDKTICNIIPVGDSDLHSDNLECECKPNFITKEGLVIHNSFDEREIAEYKELKKKLSKIELQLDKCRTSTIQDGWQTQKFSKKARKWDYYSQEKMSIMSKMSDYENMIHVKKNECSLCDDKCTQHSIKFNSCNARFSFFNGL